MSIRFLQRNLVARHNQLLRVKSNGQPLERSQVPHPSRPLRRVGSYDRTATNFRSSVLIFYARRTRSSRPACRNKLPLVGVELNAMYLTSAAHDPRAFWIELGPFLQALFPLSRDRHNLHLAFFIPDADSPAFPKEANS